MPQPQLTVSKASILKGDETILEDITVYLVETTEASGAKSVSGGFNLSESQHIEAGGPYRIKLDDYRRGEILVYRGLTADAKTTLRRLEDEHAQFYGRKSAKAMFGFGQKENALDLDVVFQVSGSLRYTFVGAILVALTDLKQFVFAPVETAAGLGPRILLVAGLLMLVGAILGLVIGAGITVWCFFDCFEWLGLPECPPITCPSWLADAGG